MDAELNRLLQDGIRAARAGDNGRARDRLLQVIARDQEVEAAWLWLSGVVDDPAERRICLGNVLILNPGNRAARDGLRWLEEQENLSGPVPEVSPSPEALDPVPDPVSQKTSTVSGLAKGLPHPAGQASGRRVDIDPFGCPFCGGAISEQDDRCSHCDRLVTIRQRKRSGGLWVGWVVLVFLALGALVWLEGFFVAQLGEAEQIQPWLDQTVMRFVAGPALMDPEHAPGDILDAISTLTRINTVLAVLCGISAVGLALKIRAVYFASFVIAGIVAVAAAVGLLTEITGWLPAVFRVGLVAAGLKWLADASPSFEWDTRYYDADTDPDLATDMDYYNRGQKHFEMGMWAKAAAHWEVASQLAPNQVQYHIALANAYARMGYPQAAVDEADRALVLTPDDQKLQAFRDTLSNLEVER
jgi:predicted nucleic acid-binding Zn ribbon protein